MKVTDKQFDELITWLKAKAKERTHAEIAGDDFNADDASGGNFDDAYSLGEDDGEIILARDILLQLKK